MKWPQSISGQILYPLTADGYQIDIENQPLYYPDDGVVYEVSVIPYFDTKWRVRLPPSAEARPLAEFYRCKHNATRSIMVQKQQAVGNLISEINALAIKAHTEEQEYVSRSRER